ncbi:glycosyltransferase family 2 protein [Thalassospira xiamenensis]|uniref:Glycosyltransferase, GT2 family n=1 Tax=Thalassospira xiamenensis TaxID=220697 RepID=A0A285RKC2_9PROT|nr:glycosyltransferase family 2 protein [Thalassospira xiamenensis]SOB94314.1 Glycosyltransferase, GT2 family [Thalassospira xiamenensis]
MQPRTTVVTVTYNSGLVFEDFLRAIPKELPLIVIDNASTDNTLELARAVRPDALLICNKTGLGYGNAASIGLKKVETEFGIIANPDSIVSLDAITKLEHAADMYPDAGMLGPIHLDADQKIELSYDVDIWKRKSHNKVEYQKPADGPICVEFLSGAVNLIRMTVAKEIGYFDPNIYLYFEDDDLCIRLRRAGYSIILVPQSIICHLNGGSVRPNSAYYWRKFWHIAWSRIYFERKYKGSLSSTMEGLKLSLKFGFRAISYFLIGNRKKSWRDLARFSGTVSALVGIRATKITHEQLD